LAQAILAQYLVLGGCCAYCRLGTMGQIGFCQCAETPVEGQWSAIENLMTSAPPGNAEAEPKTVGDFQRQVSEVPFPQDEFQRQVSNTMDLCTRHVGEAFTNTYRLKFQDTSGTMISPWHDIPLATTEVGVFRMLVEIPKMTKSKFEVSTKEEGNPIAQDVKKGKLREYHGPIFWNYGMFPQTWEDPEHEHPDLKVKGDNDPLDVVEIGAEALECGAIVKVKVLGVLAMIDDGELDWKVIAIRVHDSKAHELNDINDVEEKCPGTVSGIREWLRWYKTPDSKPLNTFGYDERALDRTQAIRVVAETHEAWKRLHQSKTGENNLWMTAMDGKNVNDKALGS